MKIRSVIASAVGGVLGFNASADAVITYAQAERHITAPVGRFAGSGWEWQGKWGGNLGTPIAPHFFITVTHIQGNVGDPFIYQGKPYTSTAFYDDPNSDLRLVRVAEAFTEYPQIYKLKRETGRTMMVYGRGTQRGAEIRLNGELKGYRWGASDIVQSWGRDTVEKAVYRGPTNGDFLAWTFDATLQSDQAALTAGDSGGGLFIKDGRSWKLAGVNVSIDGPWGTTANANNTFQASMLDAGGYYVRTNNGMELIPDGPVDVPGRSYAIRISTNRAWINGVLGGTLSPRIEPPPTGGGSGSNAPEPALAGPLLLLAGALLRRSRG
jgi:hypothetical protein